MRLLDLFCGRWGWSREFAKRGWECVGVDLSDPPEIPPGCDFWKTNVAEMEYDDLDGILAWRIPDSHPRCLRPDFIVASPPCEEFSVWGMKHFHPHPKYPENGIKLFNHTRELCEASGLPYVIENVRVAQQFVGNAVHHCGPFYLWGNAVPPLVHRGIIKGMTRKALGQREYKGQLGWNTKNESANRRQDAEGCASLAATIPPELAGCVADYAERICERSTEKLGIREDLEAAK